LGVSDRLLTPSKISAWLDCAHSLTLSHRVDDGSLERPTQGFGSFARLLLDKGLQHEAECLAEYRRQGKSVFDVPPRGPREPFQAWVDRIGDPFADGWDVIYQLPMIHKGIRGVADFLVRVEHPVTGFAAYEPVDAKLARSEAKPGHVLQLCFYAEAIHAALGVPPHQLHVWLGSGQVESLLASDVGAYWRRMRSQLAALLDEDRDHAQTAGARCDHCAFCEFSDLCISEWRSADSLVFLSGFRSQDRDPLATAGVSTLSGLAARTEAVSGVRVERMERLVGQAVLQVQAREAPDELPPYALTSPVEGDAAWGHGFALLPEPDAGDVFLDFEGHPFWRPDTGLFFLLGLIERSGGGEWTYRAFWAHDLPAEAAATQLLVEHLAARRLAHPAMHVYHYNHTERSALQRLASQHGVVESLLTGLVETGLFVDLLVVARNAMQVGVESYGLKHLERLTPFERGHEIDKGAGAVVEYEQYAASGDLAALQRIASYNEDDVRATRALRDWLVERRPADAVWRAAVLDAEPAKEELDAQVAALHAFGPGTAEHLLGDVLGYWLREWLAHLGPLRAKADGETSTLLNDPEALAGLVQLGLQDREDKGGKARLPLMRLTFPEQSLAGVKPGQAVIYSTAIGPTGYASITRLDPVAGEVDLVWNERARDLAEVPTVVIVNDWVSPKPKPEALSELANRLLDPRGAPNPVALALLRRDLPTFAPGHGPAAGRFTDDLVEMMTWVRHLDHSCVAVQGPPGTGKTYRGGHLIRSLVLDGQRVGITAMSHHAIDNLLQAVIALFAERGESHLLHAVKRGQKPKTGVLPGVAYAGGNGAAAAARHNLVAGTTWLFAGQDMAAAPVDVLIVDEAGQLGLADALAASRSARNLVLLGDPLQLAQVAQAVHPAGAGASVLEHVLGDDVTMPPERGAFLAETRRMHPDVCAFISEEIYEGRLSSHDSCRQQTTQAGTGLRWIRAHHTARTTASVEEAEIVSATIDELLGTPWTDQHGRTRPLGVGDVMLVAPYNDQVDLIRERLDRDDRTRGVPVGTVDKFQGREAAVVVFSMTTSSADDMTRGADFLFSRNRLNVAVSRARCLAYLVCTEELLNSRARTVADMRLLSALCAFAERCP